MADLVPATPAPSTFGVLTDPAAGSFGTRAKAFLAQPPVRRTLPWFAGVSAAGLTGVEIEAALAQRSFDVRTSALVSLACAIKSDNAAAIENARQQATALGWSDREIASFARIAKGMIDAPTLRPSAVASNRENRNFAAQQ